jgi:YVTN family beta-propeller protein
MEAYPDLVYVIPVANGPVASSLVPNQTQIYVVSRPSRSISIIDVYQNKVIGIIPLTAEPSYITISPDGKYAWVLSPFNNVTIVAMASRTIVVTLSLGNSVELKKIVFRPDGKLAWVVGGNYTGAINTTTYDLENDPISVGGQSGDLALTYDGQWALVPSREDNLIVVIRARDQVLRPPSITVGVGKEPWSIVTSLHKWEFVANYASETVSVIDADKLVICANISSVPSQPYQLLISPDGNRVYGLGKQGQSVFAIKIATQSRVCSENQLIGLASVPTLPYAMAITSDGSRIVVTHMGSAREEGSGITIVDVTKIEDLGILRKTIWVKGTELGEPILVNE